MKILHDIFPTVLRALQLPARDTPLRISDEDIAALDPYDSRIAHGRLIDRARVVVTQGPNRIVIAVDQPDGVKVMFDEEYESVFTHPRSPRLNPIQVLMPNGKLIVLKRDNSCGCGSRLRGWNPYTYNNIPYAGSDRDPTE